MTHEELEYKEHKLRECFIKRLEKLDVDGTVPLKEIKELKTYGALWHYTQELLEEHEEKKAAAHHSTVTADSVSGLKMIK